MAQRHTDTQKSDQRLLSLRHTVGKEVRHNRPLRVHFLQMQYKYILLKK